MSRYVPVVIALCVVASLLGWRVHRAVATTEHGLTAEQRAATLRFDPTVSFAIAARIHWRRSRTPGRRRSG